MKARTAAVFAAAIVALSAPPAVDARGGAFPTGVCEGQTLAPFFRALDSARTRPVHILQIGDSHTANENFAGAWRDILQARYGDAGRGVLPPGRPWAGYVTRQVTVTKGQDWSQVSVMSARNLTRADLVFGAAGFRISAPPTGGDLHLQAEDGRALRRFVACAATGPGAGTLTLTLGPQSAVTPLRAPRPGVICPEVRSDMAQTDAGVAAAGAVDLLSWASFSGQPGVAVSNLGVPGSELSQMALGGDDVLIAELAAYRPDLIVLAFGTNEGFAPNFSSADYAAGLRGAVRRLRRLAPGVPILLLGAPDAQSRNPALSHNSDQGHTSRAGSGGWFSPPALQDVRAVQKALSADEHVALWDWAAAMGPAAAWATQSPPLMRPDHVHYTPAGGRRLAERLQSDLDAEAARH